VFATAFTRCLSEWDNSKVQAACCTGVSGR
jgi:hypothetical protein